MQENANSPCFFEKVKILFGRRFDRVVISCQTNASPFEKALNELIRVDIFRLGKDGRDEIRDKVYGISMELVSLTPAGMLLYALHGNHTMAKEHRKCTRHIYEGEPKTGAAAGKFFISLFYDLRVMAYKLRVLYQLCFF